MLILSDLQNKASKKIKEWYSTFNPSKKSYFVLAGIAGSGKSSIVNYIIDELGIENYATATYTGMASVVLKRKGIPFSSTIHRLIYNTVVEEDKLTKKKKYYTTLKDSDALDDIDLIVIDECYMVPDKIVKDLLTFNKPIIFVGDPLQLPPITGFNSLEYDFFLDEPHRQSLDNPIIYIANLARQNKLNEIRLGTYGDNVRVLSKLEFDEECLSMSDQIICGKNKTVEALNTFYRSEFLGFEDRIIHEGEKIMCTANNWGVINKEEIALVNGLIGTASSIRVKPKTKLYELDFKPDGFSKFEDVLIDKLAFEKKELDKSTEIIRLPLKNQLGMFNEFVYAYVITTHKSQGSEFPYVTFFPECLSRDTYFRLFYTGVTRASKKLDIIF